MTKSPNTGFTHESTNAKSTEWYTPPEIFDALGLQFDLDPCSPGAGRSFVPADHVYTEADDGLVSRWFGSVWCNPPYGPAAGIWMRKLAGYGDGIGLVFARVDTKWAQEVVPTADLICFMSGRISFFKGDLTTQPGGAGSPSMLLAFGAKCSAALRASGLGVCVTPER